MSEQRYSFEHIKSRISERRGMSLDIYTRKSLESGKPLFDRKDASSFSKDELKGVLQEVVLANFPDIMYGLANAHGESNPIAGSFDLLENIDDIDKDRESGLFDEKVGENFWNRIEEAKRLAAEIAQSFLPPVELNRSFIYDESLDARKVSLLNEVITRQDNEDLGYIARDIRQKLKIKKATPKPKHLAQGLEIEQVGISVKQAKIIDSLQCLGLRIEQDSDREIIVPPTEDINLIKELLDGFVSCGVLTDPIPAVHITSGFGGKLIDNLSELMWVPVILDTLGPNGFKRNNPNFQSLELVMTKDIFDGLADRGRFFPMRFRRRWSIQPLVEYRDIFDGRIDNKDIISGIESVRLLHTQILDKSKFNEKLFTFANLFPDTILGDIMYTINEFCESARPFFEGGRYLGSSSLGEEYSLRLLSLSKYSWDHPEVSNAVMDIFEIRR